VNVGPLPRLTVRPAEAMNRRTARPAEDPRTVGLCRAAASTIGGETSSRGRRAVVAEQGVSPGSVQRAATIYSSVRPSATRKVCPSEKTTRETPWLQTMGW